MRGGDPRRVRGAGAPPCPGGGAHGRRCWARARTPRTSCRRRSSRPTARWAGSASGAAFRPWLLRIVANETSNLHRAAGRRRSAREQSAWERTEPLLSADTDDPAAAVLSRERRAELVAALSQLSEAHRRVVTCRYLLDLDEGETATVLGWREGHGEVAAAPGAAAAGQGRPAPTTGHVGRDVRRRARRRWTMASDTAYDELAADLARLGRALPRPEPQAPAWSDAVMARARRRAARRRPDRRWRGCAARSPTRSRAAAARPRSS